MSSKMQQWSEPFTPWPKAPDSEYNLLEPYFNPPYEGTGWPGTGFGMRRRKVVPLPRGYAATQTTAQGYGPVEPVMDFINPQGSIDPLSTYFKASVVSLGSLKTCAYYPQRDAMDASVSRAVKTLSGLGLTLPSDPIQAIKAVASAFGADVNSDVPGFPKTSDLILQAISKSYFPPYVVEKVTNKILADEKEMNLAWAKLQWFKSLPPELQPVNLAQLQKDQEDAFAKLNSAKYYALLLPGFQDSLGFTSGKPKVSAPNYDYIRARANSSVTTKVASWLREVSVQSATKALMEKGYLTGSLNGLGQGGPGELVVGGVVITSGVIITACISVAAIIGFLSWVGVTLLRTAYDAAELKTIKDLQDALVAGKITQAQFDSIMAQRTKFKKAAAAKTEAEADVAMWAALGVGAVVVAVLAFRFLPRASPALPAGV